MSQTKITVIENGPFIVEGDIEIKDKNGEIIKNNGERNALCRCSHSNKKPFCDGSHSKVQNTASKPLVLLLAITLFNFLPVSAADSWKIDPVHSQVGFSVRHMMISNVHGNFTKFSGKAIYDGKDFKNSNVEATIDVASIDTHDSNRDTHLKTADFFDSVKYPQIKFVSKKVSATKSGFDILGDLTMHGVTKQVVLHADKLSEPITDPYGNTRVGTCAKTQINRKDFGMTFNKQLDNGGAMVADDVAIDLEVELVKEKVK